ncbi:MAG: carbohydrate ABC transporter permease [Chloroflexi bacterium]|nr:carbohydrate ABC transporter permease [Chloroflexota bacterium]
MAAGYLAFALFVVFPIVWIFLMSIKEFRDIIAYPPRFIFTPTLDNYRAILLGDESAGLTSGISDYTRFLFNSIIISGGAVLLSGLVGIPAAFSLARAKFRGSNQIAFTFLSFRFAPELAIILPLFVIYRQVGLYDTYVGMILVHQLITLPLTIWMMLGFFQEVPREIEESARVDGANLWQVLARVSLPVVRPGIASTMIIAFIFSWNNLIFGLVLAGGNTTPVTMGILQTMNFDQIKWGWMAAAAMISSIPGMIVAIYFQRHLTRGLTMGALK